ncbi:hypothetical protein CAPTEDRAFT_222637 [Capitella teleta]|uniref:Ubiquitin carboxyl-terminal hydrolase n=1 Tax=Capitella teleta TaxID=283909 RepID=R7UJJ7_CAPTE|nr:hypothetical protein CAPTEDRAFT_222637 [Capitella teleta]|eukprot:ELU03938.1 hypothetical protein CAPTEDRAFT_222637 [Capitella teleta]
MDSILTAMLRSTQPEAMKSQFVRKILSLGKNSPNNVLQMLNACLQGVVSESDASVREKYQTVYLCWAEHNIEQFTQFFTASRVNDLLESSSPDSISLLQSSFSFLQESPHFYTLCSVVQARAVQVVRLHMDFATVSRFCRFLNLNRHCIPQGVHTASFCVAVIHAVSTIFLPKGEGYPAMLAFVEGVTNRIGGLLQHIWLTVDDGSVAQCLHSILSIISTESERDPSFALGGIVQFLPTKFVASITAKTVAKDSDASMMSALSRMIDWLAWPGARNIHLWIIAFLQSLAKANRFGVLINITHEKITTVYDKLQYPVIQEGVFAVLSHLLLSFRSSPLPFHKIVGSVPATITQLETQKNHHLLESYVHLLHCLMQMHPGYPDLYEPILEAVKHLPVSSPDDIQRLMRQSKWHGSLTGSARDLVLPEFSLPKSETGRTGLVNLGNTCFMNSVLQVLFMTRGLRHGVLDVATDRKMKVLYRLQELFAFLTLSQRAAYAPSACLEATRPSWFARGCQQDCSEYLRFVLDQLHEEENPSSSSSSLVQKCFGGRLLNTYTCSVCGRQSSHTENFNDLPLAFPELTPNSQLEDLLTHYLRPEILKGSNRYHCESCQELQEAERSVRIEQAPQYLILTLLRFSYSAKTQSRAKILSDVKYPSALTLPVLNDQEEAYELTSVIVHSGTSSESGHYYAYARSEDDRWILFNDSRVSFSSFASFSSVTSKFAKDTAYVLVYAKTSSCHGNHRDTPLHADLVSAVEKDNLLYVQEEEAAREREMRQREKSSSNSFSSKWNDHNGPPGSCGGGGFGSMPRFVC